VAGPTAEEGYTGLRLVDLQGGMLILKVVSAGRGGLRTSEGGEGILRSKSK